MEVEHQRSEDQLYHLVIGGGVEGEGYPSSVPLPLFGPPSPDKEANAVMDWYRLLTTLIFTSPLLGGSSISDSFWERRERRERDEKERGGKWLLMMCWVKIYIRRAPVSVTLFFGKWEWCQHLWFHLEIFNKTTRNREKIYRDLFFVNVFLFKYSYSTLLWTNSIGSISQFTCNCLV